MRIRLEAGLQRRWGPLSVLYPGLALGREDSGFHGIGRLDHSRVRKGLVVKMHPHFEEDILTYLRAGRLEHTDSEGFHEAVTPTRLMLMRAGRLFRHEEAVREDVEGLQIFLRPRAAGLEPAVFFEELEDAKSLDRWRLLASPDAARTRLALSSNTFVYDVKVRPGSGLGLPEPLAPGQAALLYVFRGALAVEGGPLLAAGEGLLLAGENPRFTVPEPPDGAGDDGTAGGPAELVLLVTDTRAPHYDGGLFAGNVLSSAWPFHEALRGGTYRGMTFQRHQLPPDLLARDRDPRRPARDA